MSQFYSKNWVSFTNRPTPLLKRALRNLAYLYAENISSLKISRVLTISEKEFASTFIEKNEDDINYQKVIADYRNRKADKYLANFIRTTQNLKPESRDVFEQVALGHKILGAMLVYSHYLERILTEESQKLNKLNKREKTHFGKLLKLNNELRDKAIRVLDFDYYDKVCQYLRKKRQNKNIDWCLVKELLANKKVSNKEILKRKKFYVLVSRKGSAKIFTGGQAISILKKNGFVKTAMATQKELKGFTVYRGNVAGKIKIIKNLADFKKDYQNKIIVSPMTILQFVPYLKKVKAIVTDEGGINCHAAITAREFKIPCIVGTKIATKVLKDGDLVEVDANKGIVKIIKK